MDESYNENSNMQRVINLDIMKSINSIIKENIIDDGELKVADFGVSTGCNADLYLSDGLFPNKDKLIFIGNDLQSDRNWDLFKENMEKFNVHQFEISNGCFFTTPVCADSSLALCFSSWALHWVSLENFKNENPDATYCNFDSDKWKPIALEQFQSFLNLRSRELRPGGLAILINGSRMDEKLHDIFDLCWGNAKQKLYKNGLIGENEMCDLFLPIYVKSKEEIEEAVRANKTFEMVLSEMNFYEKVRITKKEVRAFSGPIVSKAVRNTEVEEAFWREFPDFICRDFIVHVCILRRK